ncbi:uncharacterized protein LOC113494297 [Trichoplusia ni]|uniref:Uncharacterized protein LOC113494297 n=1 Tax=Trichoplusia ni TaxID=7111 RepID=A0A7E5VJA8_TRINI|nr:uncharacterized protein LOC113494297 [Trichoplusia ni]
MDGAQASTSQCVSTREGTSRKGGRLLFRGGYEYNWKRQNKDSTELWRCAKKNTCSASIKTKRDPLIVLHETSHNHEPKNLETREIKQQMEKCTNTVQHDVSIPIPQIFSEHMEILKQKGIHNLPKFENVSKHLYQKRNNSIGARRLCFSKAAELIIPEKYLFLLFADYQDRDKRILIFGHKDFIGHLRQSRRFFFDGTFKICPKAFYQLFTIHADIGSTEEFVNVIPILYALLPDKKLDTYQILFEIIKSQLPEWEPTYATMDFEVAIIVALQNIFPDVKITGCNFHFNQCLWRRAKTLNLDKTQTGKAHIKLCAALSHIPKHFVEDGWLYIMAESPSSENFTKFNDYFVNTWLEDKVLSNIWCTYNEYHKTNNIVESWNHKIKKIIKVKPNIGQLLQGLNKDVQFYSEQLRQPGGIKISKRKPDTLVRNWKIQTTVQELLNGQISIGHCLEKLKF